MLKQTQYIPLAAEVKRICAQWVFPWNQTRPVRKEAAERVGMVDVLEHTGWERKARQEGVPGFHPYLLQVFLLNGQGQNVISLQDIAHRLGFLLNGGCGLFRDLCPLLF